jgi:hypothetical protein
MIVPAYHTNPLHGLTQYRPFRRPRRAQALEIALSAADFGNQPHLQCGVTSFMGRFCLESRFPDLHSQLPFTQ